MRAALFRTPVANVRAQFADLLGEPSVAGDRIGAQTADRRALDAAGRTVIFAFLADHVREAVAALSRAVVAGGETICIGESFFTVRTLPNKMRAVAGLLNARFLSPYGSVHTVVGFLRRLLGVAPVFVRSVVRSIDHGEIFSRLDSGCAGHRAADPLFSFQLGSAVNSSRPLRRL